MKSNQLIIIGGGASITEGIKKGLWKLLKGKFTLGLNYSYHYYPNSTCQIYVDNDFYTKEIVKGLFNYNELTGELSYINTKGKGKRKDKKVGHVNCLGYLVVWADNKLHQSHRLIWLYCYGHLPKRHIS